MTTLHKCSSGHNHVGWSARYALAIALILGLTGCATPPKHDKQATFRYVQDAVRVRVTPLSVARWDDYVDALQAQFTLTADGALVLAVPQTSLTQNSTASALSLGFQVGLPQSANTGSQTAATNQGTTSGSTNSANGGVVTNTTTTTTNNSASVAGSNTSTVSPGVAPASALQALTVPSASGIPGLTGTLQSDAITSYSAATAIYEEVQLLNRYLKDAALRYGYVPYLARLQVSVVPLARNEPYDVYLDIGLFSTCHNQSTDNLPTVVVPLLVTDDIEKGQAANSENVARQLALGLAGVVHNVGVGGSLSSIFDQFKSILADDFNSLFMVSRGAENVLEVRIGAATSSSGYSTLAQTHNITFLVLVRREHAAVVPGRCVPAPEDVSEAAQEGLSVEGGPVVQLSSVTRVRNSQDGRELENSNTKMLSAARKVAVRFPGGDQASLSDHDLRNLVGFVATDNYRAFKCTLNMCNAQYQKANRCYLDNEAQRECDETPSKDKSGTNSRPTSPLAPYGVTLWTGLAPVASMSDYVGSEFNLPYRSPPPELESQTVIVKDNCKDTATVSLVGFSESVPGQFLASLDLKDNDYTYSVAATGVAQSAVGTPLTLTFPTLHELGRDVPAIKNACTDSGGAAVLPRRLEHAKLTLRRLVDNRWTAPSAVPNAKSPACFDQCTFEFGTIVFDGAPQLALNVGLSAAADTIVADPTAGVGNIRLLVTIGKDLDSVTVAFNGAAPSSLPVVTGAASDALVNGGVSVTPTAVLTGPVVLDVPLKGLAVGRAVVISATGQKNGKATTSAVPVVAVPIVAPLPANKAATVTP